MAQNRTDLITLAKKNTDRVDIKLGLTKIDETQPEYYGFADVITEEMAELALHMGIRVPITPEELAKKAKRNDVEHVRELLEEMAQIGLIEFTRGNPTRTKKYVLTPYVEGSGENMTLNIPQAEKYPDIPRFFEQSAFLPLKQISHMVPPGGAGLGMHVIPVESAIPAESKSLDIEHITHWLGKYDKYALFPCSCRAARRIFNEGCGELEEDVCIALGEYADYVVETQRGHYATYDEVVAVLKRCEENGYVHQITNIDGVNKIFVICNCALGSCYALRTSQYFNTPNMSASAYRAHVDPEKCVACGGCAEVCPAGAAKLGQKLSTTHGPVTYPQMELPDDTPWGKDKWDPDYVAHNMEECHKTGTSPCKTACPAHIAVQGYIKMAAQGRYLDALKLIKKDNPFPAVCGSICNRRCEDACTRCRVDGAVAIDEIKRFIAEHELKEKYIPTTLYHKGTTEPYKEKIAVIGGGPAGLSCAYYLANMSYKPVVFEKEPRVGGMLMNAIPSFRLEKDVVEAEIDVLREMGVEFRCNVEVGKDITIPQLRAQGFTGFYVAVGLQNGGKLNIPGDDAQGVMSGIEFSKKVNLTGNVKLTGKCVVIGGGNIACDVARTAIRCGADSVEMYCLEQYDEMPCGPADRGETEADGITIHAGFGPMEIAAQNGAATGITFKKCLSVKNAEGRFAPVFDESATETVECTAILYCIGQRVEWKDLLTGTKVEFNPNGTAKADPVTYQTAEPDIFVGGDAYTGQKFVIDAIAAGKEGAISLHRFVHEGQSLTQGRDLRKFVELNKDELVLPIGCYDAPARQVPCHDPAKAKTFKNDRLPFTEEQVKAEASRCLGCGVSVVDPHKCIGCGVCTTRCEFDAIHITRDHPEFSRMWKYEQRYKAIAAHAVKREKNIAIKKLSGKSKK